MRTRVGQPVNRDGYIHPERERCARHRSSSRGFTLLDLLVSMAVITALMALLLPSIATIQESTRRIACSSNMRQVGLGLHVYASEHEQFLPPSVFDLEESDWEANRLLASDAALLRVADDPRFGDSELDFSDGWDGLGLLTAQSFVSTQEVFYCPSHTAGLTYESFAEQRRAAVGEIVSNHHYRVDAGLRVDIDGQHYDPKRLDTMRPGHAIVADSLRSIDEFNHLTGANVLSTDMSAGWTEDDTGQLRQVIEGEYQWSLDADQPARDPWILLDRRDRHTELAPSGGPLRLPPVPEQDIDVTPQ